MNETPLYAVICIGHDIPEVKPCGRQVLTEKEYIRQLSNPDATWRCPRCGAEAHWDDDCLASNPPDDLIQGDEDDIPF